VFVVRVLSRGGSAAVTLNWILVILIAPYVGLLLYYLFPRKLQLHRLKKRSQRLSAIETPGRRSKAERWLDPVNRLVEGLDPDSVHDGNRVTLLETGQQFVEQVREAVAEARSFIHLQSFIFRPDQTGTRVLAMLADAARTANLPDLVVMALIIGWGIRAARGRRST